MQRPGWELLGSPSLAALGKETEQVQHGLRRIDHVGSRNLEAIRASCVAQLLGMGVGKSDYLCPVLPWLCPAKQALGKFFQVSEFQSPSP
jgi:hypothetical protein